MALSPLATLLLNDFDLLFKPTGVIHSNYPNMYVSKLSFFYILQDYLLYAKILSCSILSLVVLGFSPRLTCVFHWWICLSICLSSSIIEGGDQILSNLVFLLIPSYINDNRLNHWNMNTTVVQNDFIKNLSFCFSILITLQISIIYLSASIGKLKVDEWRNGTAIYYWLNNNIFGAPSILVPTVNLITSFGLLTAIASWGTLLLEFLLGISFNWSSKSKQKLFYIAVMFHFLIFVFHGLFTFMITMTATLILFLNPNLKFKKNE
jgi:antimicrobial peptide system SdpB family protein